MTTDKPKWTPGPWIAHGRYIGTPLHMSFIGECRDQNGNWSNEPMSIANATLIAAAPELYEALQKIVDMNVQWAIDKYGDAAQAETLSCVVVARVALAKAREGTK